MVNTCIPIADIVPEGVSLTVQEPRIWAEPVKEFGLPLRVTVPLQAELFLFCQQDGCLVRGRIRGEVVLPCDRCAEDAVVPIDHAFDEFELFPGLEDEGDEALSLTEVEPVEEGIIRQEAGRLVLDVGRLLWEEFSLALPVKPLCSPSCLGICPCCGKNLNESPCGCSSSDGDPRMAALRQFKAKK